MTRKVAPSLRLWLLSDLHLEDAPYPEAYSCPAPDFDVLVCAGDVISEDRAGGMAVLRAIAGSKPVLLTPGNHEHFLTLLDEPPPIWAEAERRHDITVLDRSEVTIVGVRFVGCTLWSDYTLGDDTPRSSPTGEPILVPDEKGRLVFVKVGDIVARHMVEREWLRDRIQEHDPSTPLVVVTHHAPLPACIAPAFRDTWNAGNSASDLSALFVDGKPDLWIHGHVHHSVDMTGPGGTRVICNPAGRLFSNATFDEALVIDVGTNAS